MWVEVGRTGGKKRVFFDGYKFYLEGDEQYTFVEVDYKNIHELRDLEITVKNKELRKQVEEALSDLGSRLFKSFEEAKTKGAIELALIQKERKKARYMTAEFLMKKYHFCTLKDTERILYYDRGVYRKGGEQLIKQKVAEIWGDHATAHDINEIINIIQWSTYTDRSEFDNMKIALENCVLDLETFQVLNHSPEIKTIIKIPVYYDPDAKCPAIDKFLHEVLYPEDVPTIYELIGYCLYPRYHIHKAFMFVGDGSNGKSTLIELIKTFLGRENVVSIPLQKLEYDRFSLAQLYGKLANLYADLPDIALKSTGVFKMLTGGDPLSADVKFSREFINFTNTAKLIFSANKIPKTYDDTDAFFRRWVILNFPNKFEGDKRDENILQKLTTKEELSGLLNKAIEGLKRLLSRGDFTTTRSTEEWREAYIRMSDPVGAFVMDMVEEDPLGTVTKDDLYNAFVEYCKLVRLPIKAKNVFSAELSKHVRVERTRLSVKGVRKQAFRGIRLKSFDDFKKEREEMLERKAEKIRELEVSNDIKKKVKNLLLEIKCVSMTDSSGLCSRADLYELAEIDTSSIYNFTKEEIDFLLEKLKEEGLIYEPRHDHFALTEKGNGVDENG